MQKTSEDLRRQIDVLARKLRGTPEIIDKRSNPTWYALKNKIMRLREILSLTIKNEHEAR